MSEYDAPQSMFGIDQLELEERNLLIRDMAHWFAELHMNRRGDPDYESFVQELQALSDTELLRRWNRSVGEWVLGRDDIYIPRTLNDQTWLRGQVGRLLDGKDTEYGYVVSISIDRYLNSPESEDTNTDV